MKRKRIISIVTLIVMLVSCLITLTGCGEVKVYKTEHESGKMSYDSFDEFIDAFCDYEARPTADDYNKKLSDFCIYEDESPVFKDVSYCAKLKIEIDGKLYDSTLSFNADKELIDIELYASEDEAKGEFVSITKSLVSAFKDKDYNLDEYNTSDDYGDAYEMIVKHESRFSLNVQSTSSPFFIWIYPSESYKKHISSGNLKE